MPGHHVENIGLAPTEAASVGECPGPEHLCSKFGGSINSFVDKFPLILKSTGCVGDLERSNAHDEVINELLRNLQKSSIGSIIPLRKNDKVLL